MKTENLWNSLRSTHPTNARHRFAWPVVVSVCALLWADWGTLQAQPADSAGDQKPEAEATNDTASATNATTASESTTGEIQWLAPIVAIGRNAEVKAGQNVETVVVIGGSAAIHGRVREAVVAVGGNILADGQIGDAAVAVFGNIKALPGAKIDGDAVAVGGTLDIAPGATVRRTQGGVQFPNLNMDWLHSWFAHCGLMLRPMAPQVIWVWLLAGIFFVIYALLAALFPRPVAACVNELTQRPATSFFVGLLAKLFIPLFVVILSVTVIGLIVVPFVVAALVLGVFLGKAALLEFIGFRLGHQFGPNLTLHPLFALTIGAIIIVLLYMVPVLGLLVFGIVSVWGLGGAVMAAFSGLSRERRQRAAAAAPSSPPAPEPTPEPVSAMAYAAPAPSYTAPGQPSTPAPEPEPATTGLGTSPVMQTPPVPETVTYPKAGFWERMGAGFLDLVLVAVVSAWLGPFSFIVALAYFAGMWAWKGTTIGGIVLGLKVARMDGQPVTFLVALVRGLAAGFSALVLFLGFFWIGWDSEKQGWHDKIAGTVVLRLPRGTPLVCI